MRLALRPASPADLEWLVELRAEVLREDLERLGRYDPGRVRSRLRDGYDPARTRIVVIDGHDVGSIAVRVADDGRWIEHFYLASDVQGRGVGGTVLRMVLAEPGPEPFRLDVLQGSPARRLYERHGFELDSEDEVDVFMVRPAPLQPRRTPAIRDSRSGTAA